MNRNSQRVGMLSSRASRASARTRSRSSGWMPSRRERGLCRPFLRRVAEQRLDLRAHVERVERRLDAVHVGDERNVLDQRPVAHLGRRRLLLGLDDLGEVPERAGEESPPAALELRDRDLGGEGRAVLPQRGKPEPLSHDPALTCPGSPDETFLVTLTQFLRNDEAPQEAPDRLFAGPAERVLGRRVPLADDSFFVHDDDAVERRAEYCLPLGLGLARPLERAVQLACQAFELAVDRRIGRRKHPSAIGISGSKLRTFDRNTCSGIEHTFP